MEPKSQRRNFIKRTGLFPLGLLFFGLNNDIFKAAIADTSIQFDEGIIDFSKLKNIDTSKPLAKNKTLLALIETIIPGKLTDPEQISGSMEAGALDLLEENHFDVKKYIPYLTYGLNAAARIKHGNKFEKLNREQREAILRKMELQLPYISLFIRYIKSPFFSGDFNNVGLDYLSYPGANDGYHHDSTRSFMEVVGFELTTTGNLA